MAKLLEIKRIDLLVHPFYSLGKHSTYNKKETDSLLKLWKEHIDEVAKDPNRLLFITPSRPNSKTKEILEYAKKKLGDRFAEFVSNTLVFVDSKKNRFVRFEAFVKAKEFKVNPKKVKTRGLGEYTNNCVTGWLIALNNTIGLKNPIPYRNKQSVLLPKKSVSREKCSYPRPWERTILLRTKNGKGKIRKMMEEYIKIRATEASKRSKRKDFNYFKPRTHLMKKKRSA